MHHLHERHIMRIHGTLATLILVMSSFALAHHGRKYLVTGSHEVSSPGAWHLLFSSEYRPQLNEQRFGIEPGILYGVSRSWDVEFHAHHSSEKGVFRLEALALESRFGLFGNYSDDAIGEMEHHSNFGVTLLVEAEKGFEHADNIEGRLIFGGEIAATSYAMNLVWQRFSNESKSQGVQYALGLKKDIVNGIGIGLELGGAFESIQDFRWTPGIYISASEKFDLKIGMSFGARGLTDDQVLRTSLVLSL
jgi:hypothetical protein